MLIFNSKLLPTLEIGPRRLKKVTLVSFAQEWNLIRNELYIRYICPLFN